MAEHTETPEELSQKHVAFYSAATQAWLGTLLERDKAVLALSSGGLAFLGQLLAGKPSASTAQGAWYALGALAFIVSVGSVLGGARLRPLGTAPRARPAGAGGAPAGRAPPGRPGPGEGLPGRGDGVAERGLGRANRPEILRISRAVHSAGSGGGI